MGPICFHSAVWGEVGYGTQPKKRDQLKRRWLGGVRDKSDRIKPSRTRRQAIRALMNAGLGVGSKLTNGDPA
jgi:hypothetical protein